jgi:hypothetical protein
VTSVIGLESPLLAVVASENPVQIDSRSAAESEHHRRMIALGLLVVCLLCDLSLPKIISARSGSRGGFPFVEMRDAMTAPPSKMGCHNFFLSPVFCLLFAVCYD